MRRTLFVFPLDLAAVVQAACTEPIAAAQRLRYAKLIVEGGIAKDGRRLDRAAATLKALQSERAFATEPSDVPQLRKKVHYGEGKTWARCTSMTSWSCSCSLLRAESFAAARGNVDEQPVELGAGGSVAEGAACTARARAGPGGTRVPVAEGVRPGGRRRPEVVDMKDADQGPGGTRSDRCRRGRPRRKGRIHPAGRRRARAGGRRGPRCCRPRPNRDGVEGARLVSRRAQAAPVRHRRQRGPTAWWNGRIVGGWSVRKDGRSRSACSRTSARTPRRQSRPRPIG